jgi:hypothetical protein
MAYSNRIGRVVSTTEASTAGTFTPYWPWKLHSPSGRVRWSGLWVRISGRMKPFQTPRPW